MRLIHRHRFALLPLALFAAIGCAECGAPTRTAVLPAQRLDFGEFFKFPVGPMGLEPTAKLLALRGKRVQVRGYMVREEEPLAGRFMLTPIPVSLAESADGASDYLPAATLFVHLPKESGDQIAGYSPGIWSVTGALDLGGKPEANERISYVRLVPDSPESVVAPNGFTAQYQSPGSRQPRLHRP